MSPSHPDVSSGADLETLQQVEPLSPLPHKRGEPVFRDSWEAEAYAIGNLLVRDGRLSRAEWMELMASAIRTAQAAGDPDCGDTYYQHWCAALEAFCLQNGWVSADDYAQLLALWARAIANTPHGVPLALENALAS
ncbi:MAG: nitrile hydratase accessory protein, partial [Cyanobium sp.]